MSVNEKSKNFLCREWKNVYPTIANLQENLAEPSPWKHAVRGSSRLYLMELYNAVENSLRVIVENIENKKIIKNDRWHQTLLEKGCEYDLIPIKAYRTIRGMLEFRHVVIHGYSKDFKEDKIREYIPDAIEAFYAFEEHIRAKLEIPHLFSPETLDEPHEKP